MSDRGNQGRKGGAALATFGLVLTGVLQLALLAILTRVLSKEQFTAAAFLVLASTTISALAPLGVPTALTVFLPKLPPASARGFGWWSTVLLFLLSIPWALGVFLLAHTLGGDQPVLVHGFQILAAFVLVDIPSQALPAYQLAMHRHASYFATTTIFAITRLLSLAIPALLGAGVEQIFLLFLLVGVLRLAWCVITFLFLERGSLARGDHSGTELIRFGLPVSLSFLVNKLNMQVDKYLVALVAGAEAFTVYTIGAQEIPLVATLAYSATTTILPALSLAHHQGENDLFVRLWHGSATKVGLIMMPAFCYFMVFGDSAIRVLFTGGYAAAAIPFRVYLLLLPLRVCAYSGILRALGESKPVLTASVAALLLNAALVVPLYHLLGIAGPALAAVVSQVASAGILIRMIRQRLNLSWWNTLPYPALGRTFLVALVATIPAVLAFLLPGDGQRLLIGAIVLVVSYLALGRWSGVVSAQDFQALRELATLQGLRRSPTTDAGTPG